MPVAVENDGANRHDVKLFEQTINNIIAKRPKPAKKNPQGLCLDAGYAGEAVDSLGKSLKFEMHVRPEGKKQKKLKNKRKESKKMGCGENA